MLDAEHRTYMIRVPLRPDRFFEFGKRRGLPVRQGEIGYLAHCHLKELFGELAPKPFRVMETEGGQLVLLGYCSQDPDRLRAYADTYADPQVHEACRWDGFAGKAMPDHWDVGAQYDFEVRVCPVVRMGSAGRKHRKGAEVDAFLATCWRLGDETIVDRNRVYADWLKTKLEARGATHVFGADVAGWKRERLVRRDHGMDRKSRLVERPDVLMRGTLEVKVADAFSELVSKGVGRHKSFGFGMIMLKPPKVKIRC